MERHPKVLPKEKQDLNDTFEHIWRNAMGNVLTAKETPTAETLKANQLTYYSGKMYYKTSANISVEWAVTVI